MGHRSLVELVPRIGAELVAIKELRLREARRWDAVAAIANESVDDEAVGLATDALRKAALVREAAADVDRALAVLARHGGRLDQ
jgi:hypothetical protein